MKKGIQWGMLANEHELAELEGSLQAGLQPVNPRPEFVKDLRVRLLAPAQPTEASNNIVQYGLLAVLGILSGVLIGITGIKAAITLLSALGILHHMKEQAEQNPGTPLTPAI